MRKSKEARASPRLRIYTTSKHQNTYLVNYPQVELQSLLSNLHIQTTVNDKSEIQLLTHQRPQSTIPVSFKMSGYTKFRMLRDDSHLAILRKACSLQETQETIPSLSEHLILFKMQSAEVKTQEGKESIHPKGKLQRMNIIALYQKSTEVSICPVVLTHNKTRACLARIM